MSSESERHPAATLNREEREYQNWCREHGLDPEDVATMVAYDDVYTDLLYQERLDAGEIWDAM